MDSIIEVMNLCKSYPEVNALDGFNLSVKPGVFGLVGPNGSGKTTLIRILLGLTNPTSGQAKVLGLDIANQSFEIRNRIGILHERPSYPRSMNVKSYLEKVVSIYGGTESADELLDSVGLAYASNKGIGKLSAGMHQRLGFAQALAGNPELVFLDEPTANLDVQGRREIIDLIVELSSKNDISFFISSHILSELERVCHSLAFIKAGRILDSGSISDILFRYTQGFWRVRTSSPQKFIIMAKKIPGVIYARVSGSLQATIRTEEEVGDDFQEQIWNLHETEDVKILAIEPSTTLEEAYEAVMGGV